MTSVFDPNSIENLDKNAKCIFVVLTDALKVVVRRKYRVKGNYASCWTKECKAERLSYKAGTTNFKRSTCAKVYRAILASAKRILEDPNLKGILRCRCIQTGEMVGSEALKNPTTCSS